MHPFMFLLLTATIVSTWTISSGQLTGIQQADSNSKRELTIIYPGTKWCGIGNKAANYDDLGEHVETDRCCRAHDHCSHHIKALQSRYGIFNYFLYTVIGCDCNDEFAQCLSMVDTPTAKNVKEMFFEKIKPVCLNVELKKVCIKRKRFRCVMYGNEERGQFIKKDYY